MGMYCRDWNNNNKKSHFHSQRRMELLKGKTLYNFILECISILFSYRWNIFFARKFYILQVIFSLLLVNNYWHFQNRYVSRCEAKVVKVIFAREP